MLQFITHTIHGLEAALRGGCRWVQLRIKDVPDDEYLRTGYEAARLCRHYGATFIVDDRVHLVNELKADGVHLGKNDMPVTDARSILGGKAIIGATANTFEDIKAASASGADYIGLGPFRFTTTKKNLSPVLGTGGYTGIMATCRANGIRIPVVGIGGITLTDLPELGKTGLSGIAVSGLILNSSDPELTTKEILQVWKNLSSEDANLTAGCL